MFRRFFYLICILNAAFCNAALPEETPRSKELKKLDLLIAATEQSAADQKVLRKLVVAYQEAQQKYLKNPEDTDQLLRVVKEADSALKFLKEHFLETAFEAKFIEELTLFAKVAHKRGIPKP